MRVPFEASSAAEARQQIKRWMIDQGSSGEQIEDARVIVSELVANSVRHARPLSDGNLMISWAVESRGLKVSVTDGGSPTSPRKLYPPPSASDGRGMTIVDSLAVAWWAERKPSRATVHAVLSMA